MPIMVHTGLSVDYVLRQVSFMPLPASQRDRS